MGNRISEFHDVVEASRHFVLPHMQNVQLAGVRPGDWLKPLNTLELALKGSGMGETTPVNKLHSAELT